MAIKDKITEDFLRALEEIESVLFEMSFAKDSFVKKGLAYFVQFKRDNSIVEFLYGPPDFHIEMIIYTSKGKFAFRDLLQIPKISKWVEENRYVQVNDRNVRDELMWFIELMKVSLKDIE